MGGIWRWRLVLLAFWAVVIGAPLSGAGVEYPGVQPGAFTGSVTGGVIRLSNQAVAAAWRFDTGGLSTLSVQNVQTRTPLMLTGEVFQILLTHGQRYLASSLIADGKPRVRQLSPQSKAARLAARIAGQSVELPLRSADGRLRVLWRAVALEGANYVRQEIEVTAARAALGIQEIIWLDETIAGARMIGRVDGSPLIAGDFFLGVEDPMADNRAGPLARDIGESRDAVRCRIRRNAPLLEGEKLTQSCVFGVAPAGQMRRAFLSYLERERAHPYRPFLHYNSWYDVSWSGFPMNETNCVEAIRAFGEHLIRPHGVVMDALVFDDGWDDPSSLWQFHNGFPRGFKPLAEQCRQYRTRLGVWLSPFGGYGDAQAQRLKFGREQGYETNPTGFSLAGPKYYEAFKAACVKMISQYGVNHFKFDGIATGMYASGGAEYVRDTEALRRLMLELRQEDPNVFVNFTTGSWPSPFWLRYCDSLWRQGGDMGFTGKGNAQQQWLTYRDREVFRNIVGKGPLFPLNALMTQGVAWSRHGTAAKADFNAAGFKDDVRAFFGGGTSLQELYIQPDRLQADDWRVLAEAANWSRTNADVLVDTHWIGGDPGQPEVYGYASWTPRQGILMLRNPVDQPREFVLDVGVAFELPADAPTRYSLKSPWAEDAARSPRAVEAGLPATLTLQPFEVVILEATPKTPGSAAPRTASARPALIPQPVRLNTQPGSFRLDADTRVIGPGPAATEATNLAVWLRSATHLKLPWSSDAGASGCIALEQVTALEPQLGPEGYRLTVTPERVRIEAATEAGWFYGGISLRQLLPAEAFAAKPTAPTPAAWSIPCVQIEDYPRFGWRGLLVDPARHFLPLEFLKKLVDVMALHKLNTLQLHLTDDQGWRLEIKKYPRLTQLGSVRKESPVPGDRNRGDATPYGPFFYTQEQMRDLVAYAQTRHVTILPEIEMPGHFLGALTAHPEFSCTGGPFELRTRWGIEKDILCPGNDAAVAFARDVLDEVTAVFSSRFIHIGGDEAPRDRWKTCPKCQARLQAEGLKSEAQLQTWFNHRIEEFLVRKGRRLIGWDEILEGGLTPGAAVMSWRGTAGGIAAATAGHDVVMSPTTHCYFDYAQAQGPGEPESIGGFIPLATVYAFEPLPLELPAEKQRHILGAQGNLWGEYLWTPKDVEYFAFPRAAALAEVAWSPATARDFMDFQQRLRDHLPRLDALGVHYRRLPASSAEARP